MFTIRTRVIAAYTLIFGLLLIAVSAVIYQYVRHVNIDKLDAFLVAFSEVIEEEIEREIEARGLTIQELRRHVVEEEVRKELGQRAIELPDFRIQIVEANGNTLFDDPALPDWTRLELERVFNNGEQFIDQIEINGKFYRSYKTLVADRDNQSYYCALEVAASLEDVDAFLRQLLRILTVIIPISLFIAGLAANFITRVAIRPVTRMMENATTISAQNLDERIILPDTNDEIRQLGETLNSMIDRIARAFKTQHQFVANASHEMRTPLTVIQAELELVMMRAADPETKESLDIALAEIESLNGLTASLLTLARLDGSSNHLHLANVRLDELLAECVQRLQIIALPRGITLVLSVTESMETPGDRQKLKQALANIIENAVKYSYNDSSIYIHLKRLPSTARSCIQKMDTVEITVRDDGPGIDEAVLPHIFDRFYRAPSVRGAVNGSGLGLPIVKQIIELHQGCVEVESSPGSGTCFRVLLPRKNT